MISCTLFSLFFSRFNQLKATGLTVCVPDSLLGFADSCGSSESIMGFVDSPRPHSPCVTASIEISTHANDNITTSAAGKTIHNLQNLNSNKDTTIIMRFRKRITYSNVSSKTLPT